MLEAQIFKDKATLIMHMLRGGIIKPSLLVVSHLESRKNDSPRV